MTNHQLLDLPGQQTFIPSVQRDLEIKFSTSMDPCLNSES